MYLHGQCTKFKVLEVVLDNYYAASASLFNHYTCKGDHRISESAEFYVQLDV